MHKAILFMVGLLIVWGGLVYAVKDSKVARHRVSHEWNLARHRVSTVCDISV